MRQTITLLEVHWLFCRDQRVRVAEYLAEPNQLFVAGRDSSVQAMPPSLFTGR
jgi:hypothetical protein